MDVIRVVVVAEDAVVDVVLPTLLTLRAVAVAVTHAVTHAVHHAVAVDGNAPSDKLLYLILFY